MTGRNNLSRGGGDKPNILEGRDQQLQSAQKQHTEYLFEVAFVDIAAERVDVKDKRFMDGRRFPEIYNNNMLLAQRRIHYVNE